MAFAFRRGVRAITVTSSTTAVAFLANFFSPLMPIRSFGIFAGIIVPINFLLIMLFFPPAVVIYEKNFQRKTSSEEKGNKETDFKLEKFFETTWNTTVFKYRKTIVVFIIGVTIAAIIIAS